MAVERSKGGDEQLFGRDWTALSLRVTELELRLDKLKTDFRSLESEWTANLSRYDSVLKRANRLIKLEKNDGESAQIQLPANAQLQEITPDQVMQIWNRQQKGG